MKYVGKKEDFNKSGIYIIKNTKNDKIYIGSSKCFKNRFYQHSSKLNRNKHHNIIIQNSYNKYGKGIFEFNILEITNDLLIREEFYINKYNSHDKKIGYNINNTPTKSPTSLKKVREKISKTLLEKYKNGEIGKTSGCFKKGNIPWNKNKKYSKKESECMRVKKSITPDLKKAWYNSKIRGRSRANSIEVYDSSFNLLKVSNSLTDLEEWSLTAENDLPIDTRFNKKLVLEKVCKACKSGKSYKGLYFKSIKKPHLEEILSEKSDELLES